MLDARGKAKIHPIVGLKGYCAIFDVDSHEELMKLLRGNPMSHIETCTIYALGEFPLRGFVEKEVQRRVSASMTLDAVNTDGSTE